MAEDIVDPIPEEPPKKPASSRKSAAESAAANRLEIFKTAAVLAQGLAWPMLVLFFIVSYRKPINDTMTQLPTKLSAATSVAVGGLSFEIKQQAAATGNPELTKQLANLSKDATIHLIEIGFTGRLYVSMEEQTGILRLEMRRAEVLKELADAKLIFYLSDMSTMNKWLTEAFDVSQSNGVMVFQPKKKLTAAELNCVRDFRYQLTPLGKSAYRAIIDAILVQLDKGKPTSER